jgi:aspartate 1-decarboxylase
MKRFMLHSKIHRCVTTGANLDYVGSITIDPDLLRQADIRPHERVQVVNLNNGERFETYAIEGEPGSGTVEVNGAAARLCLRGDLLIIMTFVEIEDAELDSYKPTVVFVDEENRVQAILPMSAKGHPLPASAARF